MRPAVPAMANASTSIPKKFSKILWKEFYRFSGYFGCNMSQNDIIIT